jgi:hypothetical protein
MRTQRAYFKWLVRCFCTDPEEDPRMFGFHNLLEQMYRKDYYYTIQNDENRADDGLNLRYLFRTNYDEDIPDGPCSFLEFLIGVSIRLSEMLAVGDELPPYLYFWELAIHLGLDKYTDKEYGRDSTIFMVDLLMTDFMDRKYGRDGCGGLFPLSRPRGNQTRKEVWYQMQDYLLENPSFFMEMKV